MVLRALDEASTWSQKTQVLISAFLLSSLMSLGKGPHLSMPVSSSGRWARGSRG